MVMPERHSFWRWNFILLSVMLPDRWNIWRIWESLKELFFHPMGVRDVVDVHPETTLKDIPVKDVFLRMDFKTWARCGKL